jgi:hypothetical protein
MTLRDIGDWLSSLWGWVLSDLGKTMTSSPLDWPLWTILAIIFVIVPGFLSFLGYLIADHRRNSGKATLWSVLGTGLGAILTTVVTLDAYFTMMIFDGPQNFIIFLRVCYPFMAAFFVTFFILVLQDWVRQRKSPD